MKNMIDNNLKETIFQESGEHLLKIDDELLKLEQTPDDEDIINSIFRSVHTIKGDIALLGDENIINFLQKFESSLKFLRDKKEPASSEIIDVFNNCRIEIEKALKSIKENKKEEFDWTDLENALETISSGKFKAKKIAIAKTGSSFDFKSETLRIDLAKINTLLNLVSELWILNNRETNFFKSIYSGINELNIENILSELNKIITFSGDYIKKEDLLKLLSNLKVISDTERNLKEQFSILNETKIESNYVLRDLRDKILSTRMVPVAMLFSRFPRMVQDLSKELNKTIDLRLKGSETEIDKTILDGASESLIHIVRNAIDHGIELPDVREKKGKPKTGTIILSAYSSGSRIIIEVSDDGEGIDIEAIKKTALKKNLIKEEELAKMSSKEILHLIFLPGFSTKEEVSEISGRGVGMDVVYNNITKLKGEIEIDTTPGKGTTFKIMLPMTLSIATSFFIDVSGYKYAFLKDDVDSVLKIEKDKIKLIQDKENILYKDNYITLHNLASIFSSNNQEYQQDTLPIVILTLRGKYYAFIVNKLIGLKEIVLINLPYTVIQSKFFDVVTIGDDGTVVPVLNKEKLIESLL